jgi:hypothetical protein
MALGHVSDARPRWPLSITRRRRVVFPTSLAASPFILSGLGRWSIHLAALSAAAVAASGSGALAAQFADNLDRITYKTISLAFPLC